MRSTKGSAAPYSPAPVPDDLPDSARRYLDDELHRIASMFRALTGGLRLDVLSVAPAKPRRGDIAYADGALWNPGSGEGVYYFKGNSTWVFLG